MQNNIYIYIAIMVIVTTLIRVIPLTLIRKEITNRDAALLSLLHSICHTRSHDLPGPSLMRPEALSPHGLP